MANKVTLTADSIHKMESGIVVDKPVMQVMDVKAIYSGNSGVRYRLVLSDGSKLIQGMLASQIVEVAKSGQLKPMTVIKLTEYTMNSIANKKVCVVVSVEIIAQMSSKIGNPSMPASNSNNNNNQGNQNNQNNQRPAPPKNLVAFHQKPEYNNNNNNNNSNSNNKKQSQSQQGSFQPILSLNPYQKNWKIKVRCTGKDNMRHWKNQKGEGKLFGVDLLDKEGGEIRAVMFNDAAEKFYAVFEKNKVYAISNGSVRLARKGFTHIKNDYSISLNADANVVALAGIEEAGIESQKYCFTALDKIEQMEQGSFVDVVAVVVEVGAVQSLISKRTEKELKKRSLKIADGTAKIELTLWNTLAEQFDENKLQGNPIVALKACKVSEFGGRSLSANNAPELYPKREEANRVSQWWRTCNGKHEGLKNLSGQMGGGGGNMNSEILTFAQVQEQGLGRNPESQNNGKAADYFNAVATITSISHTPERPPWYLAIPDGAQTSVSKNSKVVAEGGGWRCEKDGKLYDSYRPRYILRFCAMDFSGNAWLTAFNEVAESILGTNAKEAERMFEAGDLEGYELIFTKACHKRYKFRVRARADTYEDQQRTRYDALSVERADPVKESSRLIEQIETLLA